MLLSALVLGLMGSLHCVGMCGPIAFLLPVDRRNKLKKLLQIASYHFGRVLAYALVGLVFGLLGKGLYVFGMQQNLSIAMGMLMIFMALAPAQSFTPSRLAMPIYKMLSAIKNKLGHELSKKSPDTFLAIGVLNGFLPCGLVYMALFGAIAMGNPLQGSLYMMMFGLGTLPLMTAAIYFGNLLKGSNSWKFKKLIPLFVILAGGLFILRGMGLNIPYISPKPLVELASGTLECHP